jgi:uncharacterized protein YciI
MTYLVIAWDGRDPEALQRRQAVREQHLREIQPAVDGGVVQLGGAILDDEGQMIGSALVVEAASREELDALLRQDIYSRAGVWQRLEVYPFRRAV